MVIGQHVEIAGDGRGEGQVAPQACEALVEERIHGRALRVRLALQLGAAGVREDHVIDERPGRGLPGFGQPESFHHGGPVRTPHARHEAGLAGDRHVAARGAADEGEARLEARLARGRGPFPFSFSLQRRPDRADASRVGVDDGHGDRGAGSETQLARARLGEPARALAHGPHAGADARETLVGQDAEADLPEEVGLPATPLLAEIGPLAHGGAERAHVDARGPVHEVVGQIEQARRALPRRGQVLGQPQQLGRLHLGRHPAADVAQHLVAGRVDAGGLRRRAVVHPDHDVPGVVARGAHGHGAIVSVEGDERARGVEPDPRDLRGPGPCLHERRTDRDARRGPDVVARLLDEVLGRPLEEDGVRARAVHRAARVEQGRADAPRAHVDAQEQGLARHLRPRPRSHAGPPPRLADRPPRTASPAAPCTPPPPSARAPRGPGRAHRGPRASLPRHGPPG